MPLFAERVWETNSATGTSDFVLTGAKSGYRTFAAAYGAQKLPYMALVGSQFERGIGDFNGTTGLGRANARVIDGSAGAGARVNFSSAPEIFVDIPAVSGLPRHNLEATTDPAVGDDLDDGYGVGSIWVNTTKRRTFVCHSAAAGAAQWVWLAGIGYRPRSGRYYRGGPPTTKNTIAATANRVYASPILIPDRITVDELATEVTTLSAGNARVGIYADDDGLPGAKLYESGDLDTGTTGVKTQTGVATAVGPGIVWLAVQYSATPTVRAAASVLTQSLLGESAHFNPTVQTNHAVYVSPGSFGLPNPFGSPTYQDSNASVPQASMKVA